MAIKWTIMRRNALRTWLFSMLITAAGCHLVTFRGTSTLTQTEIDLMARRVSPSVNVSGSEPELPRVFINTDFVPQAGKTIPVPAGGDLQAAIDQSNPGDTITLQAGATYTGNFILPAKTGNGWIVIRTSSPDGSIPLPGTRMTPAFAGALPRIVSPNSEPALTASSGAHHFRLIGLEFTVAPGVKQTFNLIALGEKQSSLALLPHDLILDRLYIHGSPSMTLRRGVLLNSATTAIIDSYISDCHEVGADSQAIGGWNGAGPFKIVNNYLEGAGENFILGGADPKIENLVPSDIEFRHNHCFKPLSWRVGDPGYAGTPWGVKNLFELKNAQRVLVDGNIFEHNWTMAQNGFAILFTVRNQDGDSPWSVVQDVTFSNNIVRRTASAINILGDDDNHTSMMTRRIKISNNLFYEIDGQRWSGAGIAFQIVRGPQHITIENNTVIHAGNVIAVDDRPSKGFIFRNNLFPHNEYGVKGDNRGPGNDTINTYFANSLFKKNVIVGGRAENFPADNYFPPSFDKVFFVDLSGRDFHLASTSPYKNAGTNGKDIGCNFVQLDAAFKGGSMMTKISIVRFNEDRIPPLMITRSFSVLPKRINILTGGINYEFRDQLKHGTSTAD